MFEKKLKFKSHLIDLGRGEQLEPWFLKLNPKCEVPVLKDGVKIIPDSRRIIDYIEDNFSNGMKLIELFICYIFAYISINQLLCARFKYISYKIFMT